jgi:hypothetical protein
MRRVDFLRSLLALPLVTSIISSLAKDTYKVSTGKSVDKNWVRWRISTTGEEPPPHKNFNVAEGQIIPCDERWFPVKGDDWQDKAKNLAVVVNGELVKYEDYLLST